MRLPQHTPEVSGQETLTAPTRPPVGLDRSSADDTSETRGDTVQRRSPRAPALGGEFGLSHVAMAVAAFHSAFGLPQNNLPTVDVPLDLAALRVRLLVEEVDEFVAASESRDIVGLADALADIVYVAYGSAVTYGIDLDAVLAEVHRSNMSKLGADGRPILRVDGKVLKSPGYTPPDVAGVLYQQLQLPW